MCIHVCNIYGYVCIYMYVHVSMYTGLHVCLYVCTCVRRYIFSYVCKYQWYDISTLAYCIFLISVICHRILRVQESVKDVASTSLLSSENAIWLGFLNSSGCRRRRCSVDDSCAVTSLQRPPEINSVTLKLEAPRFAETS